MNQWQCHYFYRIVTILLCAYLFILAAPHAVGAANTPTPIDTPVPAKDVPILPTKEPGKAELVIVRYSIKPEPVHVREEFKLVLEIQNVGNIPATDYFVRTVACRLERNGFFAVDDCVKALPSIAVGQSYEVTFRQYFSPETKPNDGAVAFVIYLDQNPESAGITLEIQIPVMDSRKPKLIIANHSTDPSSLRAQQAFDLHLDIQNVGNAPADGYSIEGGTGCVAQDFQLEGRCSYSLPWMGEGQVERVTIRLRHKDAIATNPAMKTASFKFKDPHNKDPQNQETSTSVGIYLLPQPAITYPSGSELAHPFPQPDLIVKYARLEVTGALTDTPFKLAVHLQNLSAVVPVKVEIDLCLLKVGDIDFKPVGANCARVVAAPQADGTLMAYQTFDKLSKVPPALLTQEFEQKVIYEFLYLEQLLRAEKQVKFYLSSTPSGHGLNNSSDAMPGVTVALVASGEPYITVSAPGVNIRHGPGTDYAIVGGAQQGSRFAVIGTNRERTWWQIAVNGAPAWIFADLVAATAAEHVSIIEALPLPVLPTPMLVEQLVALDPAPLATAAGDPAAAGLSADALVAYTDKQQPATGGPLAAGAAPVLADEPTVIVEEYQVLPDPSSAEDLYQVELLLRNIGHQPAERLTLAWWGTAFVPIGTGSIQWVGTIPAGAAVSWRGRFALVDQGAARTLQIPVRLVYLKRNGEEGVHNETITVLFETPDAAITDSGATAQQNPRPLWLRILSGLVGLGAE